MPPAPAPAAIFVAAFAAAAGLHGFDVGNRRFRKDCRMLDTIVVMAKIMMMMMMMNIVMMLMMMKIMMMMMLMKMKIMMMMTMMMMTMMMIMTSMMMMVVVLSSKAATKATPTTRSLLSPTRCIQTTSPVCSPLPPCTHAQNLATIASLLFC